VTGVKKTEWVCACACGREVVVLTARLTAKTKSATHCGCRWLRAAAPALTAPAPPVAHTNGGAGGSKTEPPVLKKMIVSDAPTVPALQAGRDGWHLSQLGLTRTVSRPDADDDGEGDVLCDFDPNDY
jgi:hypothetical protein